MRTRAGMLHPTMLLIAGAGMALGLLGLIAPEQTKVTADNKLSPFAHKIGLAGMAMGGVVWYCLR